MKATQIKPCYDALETPGLDNLHYKATMYSEDLLERQMKHILEGKKELQLSTSVFIKIATFKALLIKDWRSDSFTCHGHCINSIILLQMFWDFSTSNFKYTGCSTIYTSAYVCIFYVLMTLYKAFSSAFVLCLTAAQVVNAFETVLLKQFSLHSFYPVLGFWWTVSVGKDVTMGVRGGLARLRSLFAACVSQRTNSDPQACCKCLFVLRQPAGPWSAWR